MNRKTLVLGFLGLAGFCAFFVTRGIGEVFGLLQEAGWLLIPIALWHIVPLTFDTLAWHSVSYERSG